MSVIEVGRYFENFAAAGYAKENYLQGVEQVDRVSRPAIAAALKLAMKQTGIAPRSLHRTLDFCGAGLPIGPALTSELLADTEEDPERPPSMDALRSIWTDRSPAGIALGQTIIRNARQGLMEEWQTQEESFARAGFGEEPITRACRLGTSVFLDIDCPPEDYVYAATNCCGTESSTDDRAIYELRTRAWVRAVKSGGVLIRTLSQNSTGYAAGKDREGNTVWCPALPIKVEDECELLNGVVDVVAYGFVADPAGEGPHTWDGLGWYVGIRR